MIYRYTNYSLLFTFCILCTRFSSSLIRKKMNTFSVMIKYNTTPYGYGVRCNFFTKSIIKGLLLLKNPKISMQSFSFLIKYSKMLTKNKEIPTSSKYLNFVYFLNICFICSSIEKVN